MTLLGCDLFVVCANTACVLVWYVTVFLMTYRSFTSPLEVIQILKKRYPLMIFLVCVSLVMHCVRCCGFLWLCRFPWLFCRYAHFKNDDGNKLNRLRICNFLKMWAVQFTNDFEDGDVIEKYKDFVREILSMDAKMHSQQMVDQLQKLVGLVPSHFLFFFCFCTMLA